MKLPVVYQRVESGLVFGLSVYFYLHLGFSLVWFVVLLFSIDVFMIGYLKSRSVGANVYNFGHSYIAPSLLLVIGTISDSRMLVGAGLIWAAHVGFDRALGYGLKLESGFQHTHLGDIGKKKV